MAAVTKDVPVTIVPTAATNLTVQVTVAALNWNCYCRVIRAGARLVDWKIQQGTTGQFNILAGDSVDAFATGTGIVAVTTT